MVKRFSLFALFLMALVAVVPAFGQDEAVDYEAVDASGQTVVFWHQHTGARAEALDAIVKIREDVKDLDISERIANLVVPVDALPAKLKIEPELCKIILQTLHDLGDVLWYEDMNVELFQNSVILDPMLLIDFIRQVITHKQLARSCRMLISRRSRFGGASRTTGR